MRGSRIDGGREEEVDWAQIGNKEKYRPSKFFKEDDEGNTDSVNVVKRAQCAQLLR